MPRRTVRKILIVETLIDQLQPSRGGKERKEMKEKAHDEPDNLTNVARNQVPNELLSVLINRPTLLNSRLDRSEVVVGEDHVRREFGDVGSGTHGDSDGGATEGGGVVDTVTGLREKGSELGRKGGGGEERDNAP
jgi:hypothetical protein